MGIGFELYDQFFVRETLMPSGLIFESVSTASFSLDNSTVAQAVPGISG